MHGVWNAGGEIKFIGGSGNWGNHTLKDAMNFAGSYQLGLGKKFLEKFDWYKFESYPGWLAGRT